MPPLDAIDRKILSLLQADSRTTMQELADKVGLSSRHAIAGSSCWKNAA